MDTLSAFAMGQANRDKPIRVFDWHKAARLILERRPRCVEAGLEGDMEWTGGTIYEEGAANTDSYTYLSSTWATPIIVMDGNDEDCWVWQSESPGWDSSTNWPQSALDMLSADEEQA